MKLSEIHKMAKTLDLSPLYIKELVDKSDDLLEIVAGIRQTVTKAGVIHIFVNDTYFKRGVHFTAKSNFICDHFGVNYSSNVWQKKFYYPLKREEIGLVTKFFATDFCEKYGSTDQFYCQDKYPISIHHADGVYNIGVKSKDSEVVHAITNCLVKTK